MKINYKFFKSIHTLCAAFLLSVSGFAQTNETFEDEGPVPQTAPFKKSFSQAGIDFVATGRLKLFGNTVSVQVGANGSTYFFDSGDNTKNPVSGNVGAIQITTPNVAFSVNSFSGYTASDALGHTKTSGSITFTGIKADGSTLTGAVTITPTNVGTFVQNGITFASTPLFGEFFTSLSITLPAGIQYIQIDDFNFSTQVVATNQFAINHVSQLEGNSGTSIFQFTVSRSSNALASSVQVQSSNGTATSGTDYANLPLTTLNFSAGGSLTQTVNIIVNGDATVESNENFSVALSNPTNGVILNGTGIGTILDDDASKETFEDETNMSATFAEASIGFATNGRLKVINANGFGAGASNFYLASTAPYTSGNQGTTFISTPGKSINLTSIDLWTGTSNGSNFLPLSATITFTGLKTDGTTITHSAIVNTINTNYITINFSASPFNGVPIISLSYSISNTSNYLQIDNIAFTPNTFTTTQVSIDDVKIVEGTGGGSNNAIFTVSRTNNTSAFSVDVASSNVSASSGVDYTAVSTTTLSFTNGGSLTQTVSVPVLKDATVESNETFNITLSNATNGTLFLKPIGVGTILDDDKICETFEDEVSNAISFTENTVMFSSTGRYKVLGSNGGLSGSSFSGFYLSSGNGSQGSMGKFNLASPNIAFKILSVDAWVGTTASSFSSGNVTFVGTLVAGGTVSATKTVTSTSNSGSGWHQNITFNATALDNVLLSSIEVFVSNPLTVCDLDNICYAISSTNPVLEVADASSNIISNGGTAATVNNTDFGGSCVNGGIVNKTYTIKNTGAATLTLSGLAVLGGADAAQFSISTQPNSIIGANASSIIILSYNPNTSATHDANITLNSNDATNNPFVINIKGAGIADPIATITSAVASCQNSMMNLSVPSAGVGATYLWSGNGVVVANTASTSATPLLPGNQTYTVRVTNSNGCTALGTNIITINPATTKVTEPISQAVCSGTGATFSISATGTSLNYLWNTGASTTSFTTSTAGAYMATVTGACGIQVFNTANLTINGITTIATQPVSQAVCDGNSATFAASATGTNLIYLWSNGANTESISISSAGTYTATVTGACGLPQAFNSVNLTVNGITTIAIQPVSQAVCDGNSATFNVSATGKNLSYAWNTAATTESITTSTAGAYMATVTGTCGTQVFSTANLTVNGLTKIVSQPISQTTCSGINALFTVSATGVGLNYAWNTGESTRSISKNTINNYIVTVSGLCGTETSNTATLSNYPATQIVTQPQTQSICSGTGTNFSVSATGTSLSYIWNTAETNTSTNASLAGTYMVTVTGLCGTEISSDATLNVVSSTSINAQPMSQTICGGTFATLSVDGTGSSLSYLWNTGETLSSISKSISGAYLVTVTGNCGTAISTEASLQVNAITEITTQPLSQTICPSTNATLAVTATGTGTLSYVWNTNEITESITTNVVATNYQVTVTGSCGLAISNQVAVSNATATQIINQTQNQTVCGGNSIMLNISAIGTNLSYTWNTGATTSIIGVTNTGNYAVTVLGACGQITTTIGLTINAPTTIANQPMSQDLVNGTASLNVSATGTNLMYLWTTNETAASIIATTSGIYAVTVSGLCGTTISNSVIVLNPITTPSTASVTGIAVSGNVITITSSTLITISGVGFTPNTNVTINGVVIPVIAIIGTNTLIATLPAGVITSTGNVNIQVANPNQMPSIASNIVVIDATLPTSLPTYLSTSFKISPNPYSNGELKIENGDFATSKQSHLQIFNALGSVVYGSVITSEITTLNLNLAKGIYFVKVGNHIRKLVVE